MVAADLQITSNTVLGGRIKLIQPADGYRAAIDPIFLAASMRCMSGENIIDLGTGVGTAAICLAVRVEGTLLTGLELQPALVELARKNARENNLHHRITTLEGDLRSHPFEANMQFDHVMANPPYYRQGGGRISPNSIKAVANMEGIGGLKAWVCAGVGLLRAGGSFSIIHTAERLGDLISELRKADAGGIEIFPLWPVVGRRAKRVIIRAVKGGRGGTTMHAGIVLHDDNNEFSTAARAVLHDGAPLTI